MQSSRRGGPSPPLTKSQVLAELDVTLALKEQASSMNPYDSSSKNHVSVLQQVMFFLLSLRLRIRVNVCLL